MFSKQLGSGVAAGRPQLSFQQLSLDSPSDSAALFKKQLIDFNHFQTQFLYIVLAVSTSTKETCMEPKTGIGGSRKRLVSITKALKVEADNLLTTQTFHVSVLAPEHKDDLIHFCFPQRSNF